MVEEPGLPSLAEPTESSEALGSDRLGDRLSVAARCAVLGAAFFSPPALRGLSEDCAAIGLRRLPGRLLGIERQLQALTASDSILRDLGVHGAVMARESDPTGAAPVDFSRDALIPLWPVVANGGSDGTAAGFAMLRALAASNDEILSAAASASVLPRTSRSDLPDSLDQFYARARERLRHLRLSTDSVAAELARAARSYNDSVYERPLSEPEAQGGGVSLLVHGTAAYRGDWWRKGGNFHTYAKSICENLYSGNRPYFWSGAYKGSHRERAAIDLANWAKDTGSRLDVVMAHSYGGVVAQHATSMGVRINKLLLLSTPVEQVPTEWRNIGSAWSVGIHLDLVLLLARRRQRFTENVDELRLPGWFLHHADSHDPAVWSGNGVAKTIGLE